MIKIVFFLMKLLIVYDFDLVNCFGFKVIFLIGKINVFNIIIVIKILYNIIIILKLIWRLFSINVFIKGLIVVVKFVDRL